MIIRQYWIDFVNAKQKARGMNGRVLRVTNTQT